MQRYLNQLLADIEMATRSVPDTISKRVYHPFFDDESPTTGSIQYVRLSDLFGLSRYAFPPSDRLTKQQLTSLLTAIENLWTAWNIRWHCPPKLTARPRYTIMVEKMTTEKISYQYDFGAEIDFCDDRQADKCPFGDSGQCYCKEVESSAQAFVDTWEENRFDRFLEDKNPQTESPTQALDRWLHGDDYFDEPWMLDEERERWANFMAEEDMLTWLYFYHPKHTEIFDADDHITPEDFDDFEWEDDFDEDTLPF